MKFIALAKVRGQITMPEASLIKFIRSVEKKYGISTYTYRIFPGYRNGTFPGH